MSSMNIEDVMRTKVRHLDEIKNEDCCRHVLILRVLHEGDRGRVTILWMQSLTAWAVVP